MQREGQALGSVCEQITEGQIGAETELLHRIEPLTRQHGIAFPGFAGFALPLPLALRLSCGEGPACFRRQGPASLLVLIAPGLVLIQQSTALVAGGGADALEHPEAMTVATDSNAVVTRTTRCSVSERIPSRCPSRSA